MVFYPMGKKKRKNKKNKILETGKISTADRQTFLEAMESLIDVQDDLTGQKFDLIEDKSFKVRKKKSSFRESGEQIEATLDLHGFWREEAVISLSGFCQKSADQGFRTVLVITGKGIHSKEFKPTLKKEVIHWLNSARGRQLVEYYRLGSRHEGGEGALILYLYLSS